MGWRASEACTPEWAQSEANQAAEHGETIQEFMSDAHYRAKRKAR
jgi:hypothetical protein